MGKVVCSTGSKCGKHYLKKLVKDISEEYFRGREQHCDI